MKFVFYNFKEYKFSIVTDSYTFEYIITIELYRYGLNCKYKSFFFFIDKSYLL